MGYLKKNLVSFITIFVVVLVLSVSLWLIGRGFRGLADRGEVVTLVNGTWKRLAMDATTSVSGDQEFVVGQKAPEVPIYTQSVFAPGQEYEDQLSYELSEETRLYVVIVTGVDIGSGTFVFIERLTFTELEALGWRVVVNEN